MENRSHNSFVAQVSTMYLNEDMADVTFVFGEDSQKVPAHKKNLAAVSSVFHEMFSSLTKEKEVFEINDATSSGFKEFLQFFYLDQVTLTMANMEEVVRLAEKYEILDCVKSYAATFTDQLTIDNLCWVYQLAIVIGNEKLIKRCEQFICAFPDDMFKTQSFLHLNKTALKNILELESLMCAEVNVFDGCIEWAKFTCKQNGLDENNAQNLRDQLGDCMNLIRFGAMPIEEFVEHTVAFEKIFTRDELASILYKSSSVLTPKFIGWPRSKLKLQLHEAQTLVCSHETLSEPKTEHYIQNPESTWFTSNVPVILGEVYCYPIRCSSDWVNNIKFTVLIFEIDALSFDVVAPMKCLHRATAVFTGDKETKVDIHNSIAISPHKMYEIRIDVSGNNGSYYKMTDSVEKTETKLDEKTTIKFHWNTSNTPRCGLVSRMHFNSF